MAVTLVRRPACPVCGQSNRRELSYGGYDYMGIDMPLVQCVQCGLKYIDCEMPDEVRESLYNEHEYFESAYAGGAGHGHYIDNKEQQDEKAQEAMKVIKRFKSAGSLLEIGCAGGYFLLAARSLGYQVSGVEISQEMAAQARALGLEVYAGELRDMSQRAFDIIYLGDVLEHVGDPLQFVEEMRQRLLPGGIVVIEVPLTYNLTLSGLVIGFSYFLRGRLDYRYFLPAQHRTKFAHEKPYHLLLFNKSSLRALGHRTNFAVRYLAVYEGEPKEKFSGSWYYRLKQVTSVLSRYSGQNMFGDRAFVIFQSASEKI